MKIDEKRDWCPLSYSNCVYITVFVTWNKVNYDQCIDHGSKLYKKKEK
jgi:hypothetical protein